MVQCKVLDDFENPCERRVSAPDTLPKCQISNVESRDLRFIRARTTVCPLQPHILPTEDLTGIYRFAVLLTGAPVTAQGLVLDVFADAGEKIHHFRNGKSCEAWLVAKVRNRAMNLPRLSQDKTDPAPPADAGPDSAALELADRFVRIPEPGRSALALLYINRFSVQEIAQILQIPLEALAEAVDAARVSLHRMENAPHPGASAEGPAT